MLEGGVFTTKILGTRCIRITMIQILIHPLFHNFFLAAKARMSILFTHWIKPLHGPKGSTTAHTHRINHCTKPKQSTNARTKGSITARNQRDQPLHETQGINHCTYPQDKPLHEPRDQSLHDTHRINHCKYPQYQPLHVPIGSTTS